MGDSPEKQQCLFCLEEETPDNILIQIHYQQYYSTPTCACRITTHTGCYIQYSTHKGRSECPICHRIYVTEQPAPQPQQEYIIIENRLYQHQPTLPVVIPEQPEQPVQLCQRPSQQVRITLLCMFITICALLIFFRR